MAPWTCMSRVKASRRDASIEITPLIDIVFLLLIFFMVSTSFVDDRVIGITLPQGQGDLVRSADPVVVTIDANGGYFLGEQALGGDSEQERSTRLVAALGALAADLDDNAEQPRIVIRADAMTRHQAVISALSICADKGLVNVNLATREASGAASERGADG